MIVKIVFFILMFVHIMHNPTYYSQNQNRTGNYDSYYFDNIKCSYGLFCFLLFHINGKLCALRVLLLYFYDVKVFFFL